MAASKPTYLWFLVMKYSYTLNFYLRTLAYDLGCYPFDLEPSRPKSVHSYIIFPFLVSLMRIKWFFTLYWLISAIPEILKKNTLPK